MGTALNEYSDPIKAIKYLINNMALSHVYAEKLLQNGFTEQKAEELGMAIETMIEGAITVSVTRKDTVPLATIGNIIGILLSQN